MLKIENAEVMGWEHAIRGMRNPMNSWEKGDSFVCEEKGSVVECEDCPKHGVCDIYHTKPQLIVGENDHALMMSLAKGGPVHAKYRRMVTVYLDITAPLYWWKEFDTYKVGTVANSCSTMHKIHAKEFTLEDFSTEHLFSDWNGYRNNGFVYHDTGILGNEINHATLVEPYSPLNVLELVIEALNVNRAAYLNTMHKPMKDNTKRAAVAKKFWWQMIQLLPTSYNQRRTVMLNYEVLHNIYHSRKNHKLDEWHVFCDWIESLPYSELIIGEKEAEKA